MIAAAALLAAAAPANKCGFPDGVSIYQLEVAMARSAAEAVEHAGQPLWQSDALLAILVSPSAKHEFGGSDVGIMLPDGYRGLHKLAVLLNATGYRFRQSSGFPVLGDPCAEHVVNVEFVDARGGSSVIGFTFSKGRIVRTAGWGGGVTTGVLKPPAPDPNMR